ncbi:MAG: hypothetical protein ACREQ5_07580, partial [Candidatus Dormibacteria bacterium]
QTDGDLMVYDENGDLQPITNLYVNGVAITYELVGEDGESYHFTGEHKVKVVDRGWVRVDELQIGDDVSALIQQQQSESFDDFINRTGFRRGRI